MTLSASVAYVAFIQASWAVLSVALLFLVLAMLVALWFLAGLVAIVRAMRWPA